MPAGAAAVRTDFSEPGCGGPGRGPVHRDIFTGQAVSRNTRPVAADTSTARVDCHLNFSTLAKARLTGLGQRQV